MRREGFSLFEIVMWVVVLSVIFTAIVNDKSPTDVTTEDIIAVANRIIPPSPTEMAKEKTTVEKLAQALGQLKADNDRLRLELNQSEYRLDECMRVESPTPAEMESGITSDNFY